MGDEIIRRDFPAVLEPTGDGRTLELRIVPHGTTSRVSDDGGKTWYEEEWVRGVFRNKENTPKQTFVNVEHERGFSAVVGRGMGFQDSADGFDGTFRVLGGPDGDKALELVNEGGLTGVSVEAIPIKSERTESGLVRRISAKLLNVSLCRNPAFPDARVLAVREAPPEDEPDPSEPTPDEPVPDPAPEPEGEPVLAARQFSHEEVQEVTATIERTSRVDELLERVGYEPVLRRAVVRTPWNGSPARFDDEQWQRSCILDRGDQFETAKTRYAFPVLEPNGDLNVNGMHAAAARLNQANATPAQKAAAARRLRRYYGMASEDMPPSMMSMAGRA